MGAGVGEGDNNDSWLSEEPSTEIQSSCVKFGGNLAIFLSVARRDAPISRITRRCISSRWSPDGRVCDGVVVINTQGAEDGILYHNIDSSYKDI